MQATDVRPAPYPRGASILVPIVLLGSAFLLPWSGSGNLDPGVTPSWSNYFVQGILLLAGGLAGLRTLYLAATASRQRRLAQNHPSQPWLWRKDWQDAGIGNTSMQHMLQALMFAAGIAVMAVAVDWWVLAAVIKGETEDLAMYAIVATAVTLAALFLASEFLKAFVTWWRWRSKRLTLRTMPGRLGQTLAAELELPDAPPVPLRIQFGVYRTVRSRRNTSLSRKGEPVWEVGEREHQVPQGANSIILEFDIPKGRPQSDWSRHTERTRWQVTVILDKRNSIEFEVPVFA